MELDFSELRKILADAKGLPDRFWVEDPIYLRLSSKYGPGAVNDTVIYEVAKPHDAAAPSFNLDLDENGEALGIEFV
jgi:hypothetical protein